MATDADKNPARAPDPIPWLLAGDPSVRWHVLSGLMGAAPDAPEALQARRAIMTEGTVPRILAEQRPDGHWEGPDRCYTAKYRGTVWTLLILAELGADGADPRVQTACDALLRDAQDPESGGFAYQRSKKTGGGLHSCVIPCLTGNATFSLIRLGMLDDPRVQRALHWITAYQRFDDAEGDEPAGWPYDRFEMCWGRHTCHMGAVKALKALAEVPPERRTPEMHATISAGAEYLLRHHVFRRSHNLSKTSKPGWRRLGFPLMYQTDTLEILWILTRLGRQGELTDGADGTSPRAQTNRPGGTPIIGDERMREALDLVASKTDAQGRWKLEQSFGDRFVVPLEAKGEPSRWITARALQVLQDQRQSTAARPTSPPAAPGCSSSGEAADPSPLE